MKVIHTPERFLGMQRLGLSLVASFTDRSQMTMDGVMFLAPNTLEDGGETFRWWSAFQFATLPDAHPATAGLLLREAMKQYPMLLGMGVTAAADVLQERMGWKRHPYLWRAVHPLCLQQMLLDYRDRLPPLQYHAAQMVAWGYDHLAPIFERLLAGSRPVQHRTSDPHPRLAVCASYFDLLSTGDLQVIQGGGSARFVSSPGRGWMTVRAHAALWRELRRRGATFAEILLFRPEDRRNALQLGYLPLAMTNRCWDPHNRMDALFAALARTQATFLVTDKVI